MPGRVEPSEPVGTVAHGKDPSGFAKKKRVRIANSWSHLALPCFGNGGHHSPRVSPPSIAICLQSFLFSGTFPKRRGKGPAKGSGGDRCGTLGRVFNPAVGHWNLAIYNHNLKKWLKKLPVTSASLVVTSALLVVTMFAIRNIQEVVEEMSLVWMAPPLCVPVHMSNSAQYRRGANNLAWCAYSKWTVWAQIRERQAIFEVFHHRAWSNFSGCLVVFRAVVGNKEVLRCRWIALIARAPSLEA